MLSESKLERRTIGGSPSSQTISDEQDTSQNDTITNAIKLGLVAATTYGLFKSGALREIAKPLMEFADTVAKEGTDKAGVAMHSLKEWSNLKHLSPAQLRMSDIQKYNTPNMPSIFRDRDSSLFYDLVQDAKDFAQSGMPNFYNVKKLVEGSVEDVGILRQMIQSNESGLKNLKTDYSDTELNFRLNEMINFNKTVNKYHRNQEVQFSGEATKAFMQLMKQDAKKAQQELVEMGYRKLTLGDIAELKNENGRRWLSLKEGAPINLDSRTNEKYESILNKATKFFEDSYNKYPTSSGPKTAFGSGEWKDVMIDSAIRVDKHGKVVDYRMSKNNAIGFMHSLANDFRLPVVQFNPFKSILGFDTVGRRKPLVGLINPKQFDPNITRVGGENTIQKWMTESFGEAYKDKGVAVINGKAVTTDINGKIQELGSGLKLHDITYSNQNYSLKPFLNSSRQIGGLNTGEAEKMLTNEYMEYMASQNKPLNSFKKAKYELGKMLDIGYQEVRPVGSNVAGGLDTSSSFDEATDRFINWVTERPMFKTNGFEYDDVSSMMERVGTKNYQSLFGEGYDKFTVGDGKTFKPRMYATTKEGFKIKNAYGMWRNKDNEGAIKELKGFGQQYFVGRNADNTMHDSFTERSGGAWILMNQLSEGLGNASKLLGFSTESKRSSVNLFSNLLFKRALPVYLATKVPGVLNYFSEPFFGGGDETGNRDNITKAILRSIVKPLDISAHKAMDFIGATNVFKFLGEMTPGTEQITELPGIHALGLGQSGEEREEYIENGYDPVRKGRFWGSGNTPLSGGKITHFRPNLYRRVQADVEFSDSKWGSRQEYYNNAWFPNPVNPFAPINHFITNRNHYDKKHYYDRPYLQTSTEGQNIPLIGPMFSATIGKVISPQQKMHKEYWERGFAVNPEDEKPSSLLTEGKLYTKPFDNYNADIHVYNDLEQKAATQEKIYSNSLYTSAYEAKKVTSKKFMDNAGIKFQERSILPEKTYDKYSTPYKQYDTPYEVYSTPSGAMNVVDVPDDLNLYDVNRDLKKYSISKTIGTKQRVTIDDINGPDIPVGNDSKLIDNDFMYGVGEQFNWLGNIAGLKGFAFQQFVTGHPNENAKVIENSGYAYSFNNDFWEENLGGLGGNLSEITRRFIPKRNNKTEYVNPIRNTMPSWMPGSSYFTDFKHGDPYSKVDNGEERLPGEGYERLHGMDNLMEFNIGSSSIGYSKDKIVQHMLKQDKDKTTFEEDTLQTGTDIHSQIEKAWLDADIAISTEVKIEDKRHGILGFYDAIVNDRTSKTGVGVVDIKSTSAKKLEELRKTKKPLDQHKRQVNYYLWATGNTKSNGHIYYVDKEDLNNNLTLSFKYSEKLLKDTLNNVFEARKEIRKSVDKGIIGRGELYSNLDKFRILADVAPYSQEFKDVSAQLSSEDLSKEEKQEATQIRERIKQQKEPLRVYPYKFKTSNLKAETVTVSDVIDNNTIVTKEYGKEHSVKFAGINVSTSNSEYYNSWDETYKDKRGAKRKRKTGVTMNTAASRRIKEYVRPGQKIKILYDADERNKYSKDSTASIRAVVMSKGKNVNNLLLNKGHAKEKENDDSPAAIRARYSKGEISFGSTMETLTHSVVGNIPFIGSKFMQVRSPYEQYRKREVYSKDFQSWNHSIRDILKPHIDENIANNSLGGFGGIITGAFIGSLFGRKKGFGKLIGAVVGGTIPAIGKITFIAGSDKERDWRPKRRIEQEKVNEYVDVLKYVKNTRLYEQYRVKAMKENNFDVESFIKSKEYIGVSNKLKQKELTDYKRKVKLDFKHRDKYNFKYGEPVYIDYKMDKKSTVSAINKEIAELQGQRKVSKVPVNALKAIEFKQAADQTMYGYEPGDSLVNIMTALPKKDRQYFKHFMDAPEEEKNKILRIAPSYLRRALQSSWGLTVDSKPTLQEYFQSHGLPDKDWVGWDESTDVNDVKVKIVHQNKLDPGEFDIWDNNKRSADATNIPIPDVNATNTARGVQIKLNSLLGSAGYEDVQTSFMHSSTGNNTSLTINRDARGDVERQINSMVI